MRLQVDIQQTERVLMRKSRIEGLIEIPFRVNFETPTPSQQVRHAMILPVGNIVERPLLNEAFCRLALVIQNHNDRIEIIAQ